MADRRTIGRAIGFARAYVGPTYRVTNPAVLQGLGYENGLGATDRAAVQALLANKPTGLTGIELQNAMRIADALRKGGNQPFQIHVQVDLVALQKALKDIDIQGTAGGVGLYRALNRTADRVRTYLKRKLQIWVGTNNQKGPSDALMVRHAGPGHLESQVIVKDKYPSITAANFGATWNRSMPGVQHRAWGRVQIATGAFMIPGRKPAFHRVGKDRYPIKPVYGPNYAREVERHEKEVRATVEDMVKTDFVARARHEIEREVARVKAKHRL